MQIIDALVVELQLDPSKFTRGQREAMDSLRKMETEATKRGRQVEQAAAGIEQGFAAVQKRMLGVAALFLGGMGIEQFIQRVTRLQTATANLAQVTGISGQTFQAWAAAAERFGVSGSGVVQGLQSLNSQQQRFKAGNPGAFGLFNMSLGTRGAPSAANRLEINPYTDSTEQIALKAAKWLENSKDKPRDAQALIDAGMSQDLVTLAAQGVKELKAALAETKRLAEVDAKPFKDLTKALAEAEQKAEAAGRKIVKELVPALISLLETAAKISDFIAHPFGRSEKDTIDQLNRQRSGGGAYLEEAIRRKEAEIKANEEKLRDAKGIYRRPIEQEQQQLIEELRKLREQMQKERAGASPTSLGGVGGTSARLIQTAFGGGGAEFGGGVGAGTNAFGGTRHSMGGPSGGLGGTPDFGQQAGPLNGPASGFLRNRRAGFAEELKDPNTRRLLGAIISAENAGAGPAVAESLMNRTELVNADRARRGLPPLKLRDMILGHPSIAGGKSFYGPVRSGAIRGHFGNAARMNKFIDQALGGSDLTLGHTDQGSAGDPNYASGGVGVNINRERFNDWGYRGSREWRQQRQREQAEWARKNSGTAQQPAPPPGPQSWDRTLIDGARSTAWGGGMGSGSQAVNVGDIHIHKPVGDVEDLASNVRGNVQRIARIVSANYGPA